MKTLGLLLLLACVACGSVPGGGAPGFGGDGGPGFAPIEGGGGPRPGCINLECQQHDRNTHISGVVYDPKGMVPLYNVFVYVPNAPLDAITSGPVCTPCQAPASGQPIATTTTDVAGHFVLDNVPDGDDIPLVLQLGKWRRHLTLPHVAVGKNNVFNTKTDPHDSTPEALLRLPKKQHEGSPDDNVPLIAVTTGAVDYGECFLMNTIGIDRSEFDQGGRVQIYDGEGGETARPYSYGTSSTLFDSAATLSKYDVVFMSCEGRTYDRDNGYENVRQYLSSGGRFFATHYGYNFFAGGSQCNAPASDPTCRGSSDESGVAQWAANDDSTYYAPPYVVDQSFPKGKAFADWLVNVGGGSPDDLDLRDTRGDVNMVAPGQATRWIYTTGPGDGNATDAYSTLYLTFNTPIGQPPESQCGRAVFSDVHVAGISSGFCADQDPDYDSNLAALEFLFFDLNSCVQNDTKSPIEPPH
jgi:hypothetical protein